MRIGNDILQLNQLKYRKYKNWSHRLEYSSFKVGYGLLLIGSDLFGSALFGSRYVHVGSFRFCFFLLKEFWIHLDTCKFLIRFLVKCFGSV